VLGILSITVAVAANVIVSNGVAGIFVVVTSTSAGIWCGLLVTSCNCLRRLFDAKLKIAVSNNIKKVIFYEFFDEAKP